MFGLFKKFKDGLAKTVGAIAEKTRGLFSGRSIDAASLETLEEALYTADFGVEPRPRRFWPRSSKRPQGQGPAAARRPPKSAPRCCGACSREARAC
jgi:hypothetical protein